ncbi:uncharacterized protein DUF3592 [Acidovorax sp. 56]|uniref:DUF3592 domain-containing protein n=1 Tax=Acidovorax sp. 56 TaxID=2035205 RepID=UPI000C16E294|nr:DUF3592 domain-containing protein [Acidovorax sp. 56]PIF25911.1 uncharacterized protein DUF3592 [Acidovorax sp. 56]
MKKRATAADKKQTLLGLVMLAVLAVPFAAAGLGILLFMTAPMVYDWARMQTWNSVPAQVDSATLQSHKPSKGGTTYRVSTHYRYQVAGVEYTGDRASITTRADNIGSFQERLGHRLQSAERTGEPVPVWVNPAQPAESVVDRSLRPGLLALQLGLALVFGAFGGSVVFWAARTLLRRRQQSAHA